MNKNFLHAYFFVAVLLVGCSTESSKNKIPALFDTKVEAEQAAKNFNCTGSHEMGDKWMPCESHKVHDEHENDSSHVHHHH